MTIATVQDQQLIIDVEGIDKLLAFKGHVTIPLEHVTGVEPYNGELMDYRDSAFGIGTIFAGKIQTGTFKENGEKSFWDVRDPHKALIISLNHDELSKLIIEVEQPDETIAAIRGAIA